MPEKIQGRIPAMVISHGSAGVQQKDVDRCVRAFNKMGIAAFIVDSFGGRGITSTMDDQFQLSPAANDADALSALKLLSSDPRIDPLKIGQIGFAWRQPGVGYGDGVVQKKHHRRRFTFCRIHRVLSGLSASLVGVPQPALTGAPLMLALGSKDDYTPAKL